MAPLPLDLLPSFHKMLARKSTLTADGYVRDVRECLMSLEVDLDRPVQVADLDLDPLQDWIDSLPGSPATRQRKAHAVKRFLKYLVRKKLLTPDKDYSEHLEAASVPSRPPKFFSIETCEKLMRVPLEREKRPGIPQVLALRDTAILWVLWEGGLRNAELRSLNLDSVTFDSPEPGRVDLLVYGKGKRWRHVGCRKETYNALKAYLAVRHELLGPGQVSNALFLTQEHTRLSRRRLLTLVKRHGAALGIYLYPHLLRHCCATHMLWRGALMPAVQHHLGHASIVTTEKYAHVDLVYQVAHSTDFHPANCPDPKKAVPAEVPVVPAPERPLGVRQAARALLGAVLRKVVELVEPDVPVGVVPAPS